MADTSDPQPQSRPPVRTWQKVLLLVSTVLLVAWLGALIVLATRES